MQLNFDGRRWAEFLVAHSGQAFFNSSFLFFLSDIFFEGFSNGILLSWPIFWNPIFVYRAISKGKLMGAHFLYLLFLTSNKKKDVLRNYVSFHGFLRLSYRLCHICVLHSSIERCLFLNPRCWWSKYVISETLFIQSRPPFIIVFKAFPPWQINRRKCDERGRI